MHSKEVERNSNINYYINYFAKKSKIKNKLYRRPSKQEASEKCILNIPDPIQKSTFCPSLYPHTVLWFRPISPNPVSPNINVMFQTLTSVRLELEDSRLILAHDIFANIP